MMYRTSSAQADSMATELHRFQRFSAEAARRRRDDLYESANRHQLGAALCMVAHQTIRVASVLALGHVGLRRVKEEAANKLTTRRGMIFQIGIPAALAAVALDLSFAPLADRSELLWEAGDSQRRLADDMTVAANDEPGR